MTWNSNCILEIPKVNMKISVAEDWQSVEAILISKQSSFYEIFEVVPKVASSRIVLVKSIIEETHQLNKLEPTTQLTLI